MSAFLKLAATAAIAALVLPAAALARGDAEAGHAKAKQVCAACHGENGDKPLQPEYPVLAGQHQDYLIQALNAYKAGARKNAIMGGQAQPLTAKEIDDVTKWFSEQKSPLYVLEK
jgi:cytochrome c553